MMFVEVLVVDAFNKTPVGLTNNEMWNYYLTLELEDAAGSKVFTNYGYV